MGRTSPKDIRYVSSLLQPLLFSLGVFGSVLVNGLFMSSDRLNRLCQLMAGNRMKKCVCMYFRHSLVFPI